MEREILLDNGIDATDAGSPRKYPESVLGVLQLPKEPRPEAAEEKYTDFAQCC